MNKKKFYVTTPIYYPSAQLHIGHAYTTTLADVLNRYKKMDGYETFFLTGSDEHGQKIEKKALEANKQPKQFVDEIILNFKDLWEKLEIKYDKFIRTTDNQHKQAVKNIFSLLVNNGDIYKGKYKGLYCISCEEFLTNAQINSQDNTCKLCGSTLKQVEEETYFFKVSKYADFLLNHFEKNQHFIFPIARKNEMINNFIKPGLEDLSVTRTSFKWGIPILEDENHIIYVWIDALSNYITALGYNSENDELFKKFWSEDTEIVQLMAKEITRFHTIYWPSLLKSLNLRLPDHIISHGWILMKDQKMSKSLGNVVDPIYLIDNYSSDAIRFFLCHELSTDNDGKYSYELFMESYNAHLVNNLGNLVSRVVNMIEKYFDSTIDFVNISDNEIVQKTKSTIEEYKSNMNDYKIAKAVDCVLKLAQSANKYIEEEKPWVLAKENDLEQLKEILCALTYAIIVIAHLLSPVLTKGYKKTLNSFSFNENELNFDNILNEEIIKNKKIVKAEILYQRLDIQKELEKKNK